MAKQQVYLDTSVIGGCCDPEFEQWSRALVRDIRLGLLDAVTSTLTEEELTGAPADVQVVYDELVDLGLQRVQESAASLELAAKYIDEGILGASYESDARHIAVATVNQVGLLVSWNFRHIVRYDKIRQFNAVNVLMGYAPLQIHTPMEVASEEGP